MPSSMDIDTEDGIGEDNNDRNLREDCREKKRLKLEIQSSTEEDDSGHNSDEDFSGGDGTGDEFNSSGFFKDQRSLSERCFGPPFQYWVHDAEAAYKKMMACVSDCQRVLAHSPTTVRILLNHRNWDQGKLYDSYYESDLSSMFKAAGLMDPAISLPSIHSLAPPKQCEICYSSLHGQEYFTPNCGHSFCNDCWRNYLLTKVMDHGGQGKIECPALNCKFLMEDGTVMEKIMNIPEAQEKYKKLITGSYIQSNRLMKWCPGPRCSGQVIELEPGPVDWRPVTCSCTHTFCFQCREPWHGPVKCLWLKKWNKKCADDSETVNWISVNTKSCPKCEVPIEKNGGCNHMSCQNSACKYQFCWICLGDWAAHGQDNYRCNRFQENDDNASTLAKKQHSLKRYLFYFDRFFSHHKSLKCENSLVQKMDVRIEECKVHGVSSEFDLQFMKKGVQVLCQCRQTLMYTYVFAYYLARNNNANIFEDNQSDLQRATEELSGHLEQEFICTKEAVDELKKNVMNKTNYCESRCEVLLKHVYEGYEENGYWSYIEDEESPAGANNVQHRAPSQLV